MAKKEQEKSRPSEREREEKLQEMLKTQMALGENIASTSQFLRFVLTLANENLGTIRAQLEKIRDLAKEIDNGDNRCA